MGQVGRSVEAKTIASEARAGCWATAKQFSTVSLVWSVTTPSSPRCMRRHSHGAYRVGSDKPHIPSASERARPSQSQYPSSERYSR